MTQYTPPNTDEIRFLIKNHWQEHSHLSKRANALDQEFLDRKVQATQELLQRLIRGGMESQIAENHALREVALAD